MASAKLPTIDRRTLLIGGGAGIGLVVAWQLWPRRYGGNLTADPGETIFGAWLKIGNDGRVIVAVAQAEHGQGAYTALPQIVADELGADWRTVGVEPAPLNPLTANPFGAEQLFEQPDNGLLKHWRDGHAVRIGLTLTAASSSVRSFEDPLRAAGAAARVLLCKAAAARWKVEWQACSTGAGFVTHGKDRLRFGELAAEAARDFGGTALPDPLPLRSDPQGRLSGQSLPRLDAPSKIDGSATFAGDVRLPDMVFASIRQGPVGDSRLVRVNRAAADRISGVLQVVTNDRWVAAIGTTWWAANRALDAMAPRFETKGPVVSSASIDAALKAALAAPGTRMVQQGDVAEAFKGARLVAADYQVGLAPHAALETMTATASLRHGRLELWLPTQAPGVARSAAAAAIGLAEDAVVVHPMLIGGSFGAALEPECAAQAAVLAQALKRPVQLVWSRAEDLLHDRYRPPARARMTARLGANGQILGLSAKIAAPATGHALARRLFAQDPGLTSALALAPSSDPYAVAGAAPVYRIPAFAIDHHPAEIGVPTGHWRSGAHSYTSFFTECFLDELAHLAGTEALSFRIGMLGGDARLARCLSTAASLGGWEGGVAGSGQGLACHSFRGSHIAVLVEAHLGEGQAVSVDRIVAAVDCGRQVNPDLVRQQIEGGLLFGMAAATGGAMGFKDNLATVRSLGGLGLPRLADTPDITVELVPSEADPGGVSELAVPPVAPAIANALQAATGYRLRSLPLLPGTL
ncbi:molybdopterin cofactor-binding domain-containing protein [Sphingomonas sp. RB3P16]|uniref:xanthine dehydrogenase family protein molybdopterin-binding subunit n=1 Tax=Parasphingomonas frigoris TaxID=3096163 RepID=UPI002FC6B33A